MTVYDRTTNNAMSACDFVRCTNCEKIMLVDRGTDDCPDCGEHGTLMWEQEGYEEILYENAPEILAGLCYTLTSNI